MLYHRANLLRGPTCNMTSADIQSDLEIVVRAGIVPQAASFKSQTITTSKEKCSINSGATTFGERVLLSLTLTNKS